MIKCTMDKIMNFRVFSGLLKKRLFIFVFGTTTWIFVATVYLLQMVNNQTMFMNVRNIDQNIHMETDSGVTYLKGKDVKSELENATNMMYDLKHSYSNQNTWPFSFTNSSNDRIYEQLLHSKYSKYRRNGYVSNDKLKQILVYYNPSLPPGNNIFQSCPFKQCTVVKNIKLFEEMDAVLFQSGVPDHPQRPKPRNQIWILNLLEAPLHTQRLSDYNGLINWTATYRRDSTLVTPYEKFMVFRNKIPVQVDLVSKTKKIAWFVSNCFTSNKRLEYVRELQRHIDVDVYGECGTHTCPRGLQEATCFDMLNKDYFFYLAFENANCRDYITEKFFHNALSHNVVPVVMGAPKEDYERVAPPHSFIHVEDFDSPSELASYLDFLITNHTLYQEYLSWKGSGRFIDTKFWCRLCSLLHDNGDHVTWYDDIEAWWNGPVVCRTSRGGQQWASWRRTQESDMNI